MLNIWVCDDDNGDAQPAQFAATDEQQCGIFPATETRTISADTNSWPNQHLIPLKVSHGYSEDINDRYTVRSDAQLLQVPVVSIGGSVADTRGSTIHSSIESGATNTARRRTFYEQSAHVKSFGSDDPSSEAKSPAGNFGYPCPSQADMSQAAIGMEQQNPPPSLQLHVQAQNAPNQVISEDVTHFHDMYSKLCLFKNTFGHTNVPKVTSWFLLGSWVQQLRKRKKVQSLRERGINVSTDLPPLALQQVQMLEAVGFCWQAPSFLDNETIIATIKKSKTGETGNFAGASSSSLPVASTSVGRATSCEAFSGPSGSANTNASFIDDMDDAVSPADDDDADHAVMDFTPLRWNYDQSQELSPDGTSDSYFDVNNSSSSTASSMQYDSISQRGEMAGNPCVHAQYQGPGESTAMKMNLNHHTAANMPFTLTSLPNNQFGGANIQPSLPLHNTTCGMMRPPQAFAPSSVYSSQFAPSHAFAAPSELCQSMYSSQGGPSQRFPVAASSEAYSSNRSSVCSSNSGSMHLRPQSVYSSNYSGSNPMAFSVPSEVYSGSQQSVYSSHSGSTHFRPQSVYSSHSGSIHLRPQSVYSNSNQSIDFSTTMSSHSANSHVFMPHIGMKRKGAPMSDNDTMSCISRSSLDCGAERNWQMKLNSLMKFKAANGHCCVPARYSEDPKLGHWVMTQRRQYHLLKNDKKTRMTPHRIAILERVGLQWSVRKDPTDLWNSRLDELCEYKNLNGNCLVPQRYSKNPQLGTWVNTQRRHFKFLSQGKRSCLTDERLKKLKDLGFVWSTHSVSTNNGETDKFKAYIHEDDGDEGDGVGSSGSSVVV